MEFGKDGEKTGKRTRKYNKRKGYKPKGFKEDKTALRRTRMISTRVDEYTLANILLWVKEQNVRVNSLSELVYLALITFSNFTNENYEWEDICEAREFINDEFGISGTLTAPFKKQLQLETALKERNNQMPKLDGPMAKDFSRETGRDKEVKKVREGKSFDETLSPENVDKAAGEVREMLAKKLIIRADNTDKNDTSEIRKCNVSANELIRQKEELEQKLSLTEMNEERNIIRGKIDKLDKKIFELEVLGG